MTNALADGVARPKIGERIEISCSCPVFLNIEARSYNLGRWCPSCPRANTLGSAKPYLEGGRNASHAKTFCERNFSRKSEEMLAETSKCGIPYRHRTLQLVVK